MPIAGVRHADAGHWQLVRDHGGGSLVVASSNASPCRQRLSVHMWTLPRTGRMATAKSSVKEKFAKKVRSPPWGIPAPSLRLNPLLQLDETSGQGCSHAGTG